MSIPASKRKLFEADRRVELKMRLAMKQANGEEPVKKTPLKIDDPPEPTLVGKLIEKVRRL
jgi:hypothetical protein